MNCLIVIFSLIFISAIKSTQQKSPSLGVQDRVALLKFQIAQEIKHKQHDYKIPPINSHDFGASYEYVDRDNEPITPINEEDERKFSEKFKLKEFVTTTEKLTTAAHLRTKKRRNRNKVKARSLKPLDIFYRRVYYDLPFADTKWTHCQDLITPFFTGIKTNITQTKSLSYDHSLVMRVVQLLSEDVTDHSRDDLYSIMFQLSNLQIRLFQWDVTAVKFLLNSINPEYAKTAKKQTFRSLKEGLNRIFTSWKLDYTNTTNIMRQARLFRPPCVRITDNEGSTKTSRVVNKYTLRTTTCNSEYDDAC